MKIFVCLLFSVSCLLAPSPSRSETGPLTMTVLPYLPASELLERFTPLTLYLGRILEREVTLKLRPSYEETIEAVGLGRVDFAFIGPAPYVLMVEKFGEVPTLGRISINGNPQLYGSIVVRTESPFKDIRDLEGASFAFGFPNSTMSEVMPRYVLASNGVTIGSHDFLGGHVNVALGVLMGRFDAGAVKDEVLDQYGPRGLRRLTPLPPVPEQLFVASNNLDKKTVERLRQAVIGINHDAEGMRAIAPISKGVDGILPTDASDYDQLREIMGVLGKLGAVR